MGSFSFSFAAPWYLALLPLLLPLVWWTSRRSLAGLSRPRRLSVLALRLAVVLLLVLALAEARLEKRNDALAVIYVLDRSESIPAEKREAARQFTVESAAGREYGKGDLVGVVAFGREAGIEWVPKLRPLELESFATLVETDSTDIAAGLRLATAAFPGGVGKRIVLLSDGNENRGNVLEEARNARAQGVAIDVVPIKYNYAAEISVEKVLLDPQVNSGEPFDVRVVVNSTRPAKASLRLFENDKLAGRENLLVDLKAGKNVFDFKGLRLEASGLYTYEARLEAAAGDDDHLLQNNGASSFTVVAGESKVLICAAAPETEAALVRALRAEKIDVEVTTPDFLPQRAEEYLDYDAVIVSNVAAHQLSEETMQLFEGLVKTIGMGFVMIGGEDSFGAGGYQGTPVERLLPVDMEIKQRESLPNGALAMVVHSCELGNGNFWARQVITQAIRILSPRDYAGVLHFDMGGDRWLFPMWRVSRRPEMVARLKSFEPGDMPAFESIMQMALAGLTANDVRASIKHMVVLSDGDPAMPSQNLVASIRQAGITITTICYGAHGTIPAGMQALATAGGGKFYFLQSAKDLPEIFIREAVTVRKSLISEQSFQPAIAASSPILQGVQAAGLPPLDGYVLTTPKPLASVPIVRPPQAEDPTQDPVLATWSYGLGKTVAFTSDAGRRWARDWVNWAGHGQFWTQLVRWAMRARSDERFRLSHSLDEGRGVVTVDALTPDGQFLNGIQFEAAVLTPDFSSQPAEARQVAPGRYEVAFPAARKGTYTVSLKYERDGKPANLVTGLSVPYSAEYSRLETNEEVLQQIAAAGGGRYHADPAAAAFFTRDFPPTSDVQDIFWNLLAAALVLFYLDVFARRVAVDYAALVRRGWSRAIALVTRRRVAPAAADPRLATLLERVGKLREAGAARPREAAAPARAAAVTEMPAEAPITAPATRSWDATALEDGGGKPAAARGEDAPPPGARPAARPGEPAGAYTARLLEAKKRALRRDKKGDE